MKRPALRISRHALERYQLRIYAGATIEDVHAEASRARKVSRKRAERLAAEIGDMDWDDAEPRITKRAVFVVATDGTVITCWARNPVRRQVAV